MARRWLVIGGGPCGIGTVGKLLDAKQSVTWVDPFFQIGRMGQFYRRVPANTLNSDLLVANRLCNSFRFDEYQDIRRKKGEKVMADLPLDLCFPLGVFVDSLEDMTTELLPKVDSIYGNVISLRKNSQENERSWTFQVKETKSNALVTGTVDAVIDTCGCKPKGLPNFPFVEKDDQPKTFLLQGNEKALVHSLDLMVDPVECQKIAALYPSTDRWLIVGDSHSGMLVIKNLFEGGIQNILNIYRSPLKFMYTTPTGCKKFQGSGLKGPVGDWAKANFLSNEKENTIQRILFNPQETWESQIARLQVQHIIVAYGFIRDDNFPIFLDNNQLAVSLNELDNYDRWTGEITLEKKSIGLFGGGIAFPQDYRDEEGEIEPWVGFKRSIEQTELMIETFEKNNDNNGK